MAALANDWVRLAWLHIWQVTALIVAVSLLTRLFARNRPHLAHALWLVVLIKCVTPPLWTAPTGVFCWIQASAGFEQEFGIGNIDHNLTMPPIDAGSVIFVAAPEVQSIDEAELIRFDELDFQEVSTTVEPPAWDRMTRVVFWIWLAGAVIAAGISAARWLWCLRILRRSRGQRDVSLEQFVARLSQRLRVFTRVRVLVTLSRIGPAVVGLWRPSIVLPEPLVRRKSAADLEPILAHELIHVRRGDLWIGLLQLITTSLWWFHPGVWFTVRRIVRESERCCDEEVIAALDCDPARYAACLLDILEGRRGFQSVNPFPGIRPVDVTSNRLERIMSLGQGSHKRTPWWCWLVVIMSLAAVLPGGALVAEGPVGSAAVVGPLPRQTPYRVVLSQESPGTQGTASPNAAPVHERVYDVIDLLQRVENETNQQDSKEFLLTRLKEMSDALALGDLGHQQQGSTLIWVGTSVLARTSESGQHRIVQALDLMRTCGLREVEIGVAIWTGSAERPTTIEAERVSPTISDSARFAVPNIDFAAKARRPSIESPLSANLQQVSGKARLVIQKDLPVVLEVMKQDKFDRMRSQLGCNERSAQIRSFKARCFSGQSCMIQSVTPSHPLDGLREDEIGMDVMTTEGQLLRLRPLLQKEGKIWLDCELSISRFLEKAEAQARRAGTEDVGHIDVPETATTILDASAQLAVGEVLLISGLHARDKQNIEQPIFVLVSTGLVEPEEQSDLSNTRAGRLMFGAGLTGDAGVVGAVVLEDGSEMATAERTKQVDEKTRPRNEYQIRTYPVADLVVPLRAERISDSATDVGMDWDPLLNFIAANTDPKGWSDGATMKPFDTTLSLVIRHTSAGHQEIAALFDQMRRLQTNQIALQLEFVEVKEGAFIDSSANELPVDEMRLWDQRVEEKWRGKIANSKNVDVSSIPKMTFENGQAAKIPAASFIPHANVGQPMLMLSAFTPIDRRAVRIEVKVAADDSEKASSPGEVVLIREGESAVLNITEQVRAHHGKPTAGGDTNRYFLWIKPTIEAKIDRRKAAEDSSRSQIAQLSLSIGGIRILDHLLLKSKISDGYLDFESLTIESNSVWDWQRRIMNAGVRSMYLPPTTVCTGQWIEISPSHLKWDEVINNTRIRIRSVVSRDSGSTRMVLEVISKANGEEHIDTWNTMLAQGETWIVNLSNKLEVLSAGIPVSGTDQQDRLFKRVEPGFLLFVTPTPK